MLKSLADTATSIAMLWCSTLPGIGRAGGGEGMTPPPPPRHHTCRCLVPRPVIIGIRQGRRTRQSPHPQLTTTMFLPRTDWGKQHVRGIMTTTPLRTSTGSTSSSIMATTSITRPPLRNTKLPVVVFDGGKDSDTATGAVDGVSLLDISIRIQYIYM